MDFKTAGLKVEEFLPDILKKENQLSSAKSELAGHNTIDSLWVVYKNAIYDITSFACDHPGGVDYLMKYAGQDITDVINDEATHKHSASALQLLQTYFLKNYDVSNLGSPQVSTQSDKFLDITKPLLKQLLSGQFTKEFYMHQVHIARHSTKCPRLFESYFLEMFSFTPWYIVPLIWIPVCVYHAMLGWSSNYWFLNIILLMIGFFVWTLIEYGIHRCLFHIYDMLPDTPTGLTIHFLFHGIHHFMPMDKYRLVMPPTVTVTVAYLIYFLLRVLLFSQVWMVNLLFSGGLTGYVCYDTCHFFFHKERLPLQHLQQMKKIHMAHHYSDPYKGFGVTSAFWDWVFGTELHLQQN